MRRCLEGALIKQGLSIIILLLNKGEYKGKTLNKIEVLIPTSLSYPKAKAISLWQFFLISMLKSLSWRTQRIGVSYEALHRIKVENP